MCLWGRKWGEKKGKGMARAALQRDSVCVPRYACALWVLCLEFLISFLQAGI